MPQAQLARWPEVKIPRLAALIRWRPDWRPLEKARKTPREGAALDLARLIEAEIIPRLMLAHELGGESHRGFPAHEVAAFVDRTLTEDLDLLLAGVGRLVASGVTEESILIDLFSPAARELGSRWDDDRASFADVTIGLCRLEQLVQELAERGDAAPSTGRDALFTVVPGDQHSFGVTVIADVFRRAGWRTLAETSPDQDDIMGLLAARRFDLVGLSVHDDERLEQLPPFIAAVRRASRHGDVRVMVGGRVFHERPGLAAAMGADGTAPDARAALRLAADLVDRPLRLV